MELQLKVNVRYTPQCTEPVGAVLRHFESLSWVRLVLRQVLPQLTRTSPTDPSALTRMVLDAESSRRHGVEAEQEVSCAICMTANAASSSTTRRAKTRNTETPIALPCGHRFHSGCVQSWLSRRSTCPLCRFQLPRVYTGTYAIEAVQSTLVLPQECETLESPGRLDGCTGRQGLHVVVKISMVRVNSDASEAGSSGAKRRRPCEVRVGVLHVNGSSATTVLNRKSKRQHEEAVSGGAAEAVGSVLKRVRAAEYCEPLS